MSDSSEGGERMDLSAEQIGEYLEHQGVTDDEIDDFLEHFGVRGMKWGVRRQSKSESKNQNARKNHDKLKRNLKITAGVLGVAAVTIVGGRVLTDTMRKNKMDKVSRHLQTMSEQQKRVVGEKLVNGLRKDFPLSATKSPKITAPSYKNKIKALNDYAAALETSLNLPTPSMSDKIDAGKKLGI